MSSKFTLNKADLVKVAKGAGIAAGGATAAYLLQALPGLDFGQYTAVVAMVLGVLLNAAVKFFQGQPQ